MLDNRTSKSEYSMHIFSLSDRYTVWTKSTIVDVLNALGDEEFQRSDAKEVLLEHLENYFVPDVVESADVKALLQLADSVKILEEGRKYKRERLVSMLMEFQHEMKDKALEALQSTAEDSAEFTEYARLIFSTDPELHAQLEEELKED